MRWTVHIDDRPLPPGTLLALDLAPRRTALRLEPVVVGHGNAEVGQLMRYRRHYPGARVGPSVALWLEQAAAQDLLLTISQGFTSTVHWTGDGVGHWTPGAWAAAESLFFAIGEHLLLDAEA